MANFGNKIPVPGRHGETNKSGQKEFLLAIFFNGEGIRERFAESGVISPEQESELRNSVETFKKQKV
jgi:hypothetical protein